MIAFSFVISVVIVLDDFLGSAAHGHDENYEEINRKHCEMLLFKCLFLNPLTVKNFPCLWVISHFDSIASFRWCLMWAVALAYYQCLLHKLGPKRL